MEPRLAACTSAGLSAMRKSCRNQTMFVIVHLPPLSPAADARTVFVSRVKSQIVQVLGRRHCRGQPQTPSTGVGEAPRHEIAGGWARKARLALWRFERRPRSWADRSIRFDVRDDGGGWMVFAVPATRINVERGLTAQEPALNCRFRASAVVAGRAESTTPA